MRSILIALSHRAVTRAVVRPNDEDRNRMLLGVALDSMRRNDYLSGDGWMRVRPIARAWPDGRVEKCSSLFAEESPGSIGQAAR